MNPLTRRDILRLGAAAMAAPAVLPGLADAQTPKRGGVFRVRNNQNPPHFDPHQTLSYGTMVPL